MSKDTSRWPHNFTLVRMSSRILLWGVVAISSGELKGTYGDHVRGTDGQTGGIRGGQAGGLYDDIRDSRLPASPLRVDASIQLSSTASMQQGVYVTTSQTHSMKAVSEDSTTLAATMGFSRSTTDTILLFSSEESGAHRPTSFERSPSNIAYDIGQNQSMDAGTTESSVHESTAIWAMPSAFVALVLIMTLVAMYRRRVTARAIEAMLAKKANDTNWILSGEAQVVKIHGRPRSGDLESGLVALSLSGQKPQTSQFVNPAYKSCYATAKAVHATNFTGNVHKYSQLHRGSRVVLFNPQGPEHEYSRLQLAKQDVKSDIDGDPVDMYRELGSRASLFDDYAHLRHVASSTSSRGSYATINDEDRRSGEIHAYEECCDSIPAVPLLTNLGEHLPTTDTGETPYQYDEPVSVD